MTVLDRTELEDDVAVGVRPRRVVLGIAALAVGAFGWGLAADTPKPALLWDGTANLALSRWVAGEHTPFLGYLGQYHLGYPLLLAPVAWLTSGLPAMVDGARVVNAIALVVATVALASLARVLQGGPRTLLAIGAGAAAALYGGLALQVSFAWSESVFAALVLVTAALVPWAAAAPSTRRWCAVGAASVAAYGVHPRGSVLVAATALTMLAIDRRRALVPGVALVVGGLAVYLVNAWAFHHLWHAGAPSQSGDVVEALLHPTLWSSVVSRVIGEVWYASAASLGLAPVGAFALVRWTRQRDPDRRWLALWVLWSGAGLLVLTAAKFAHGGRVDQLAYGRYLDPVVPLLALAGLVLLGTAARSTAAAAAVGSAATTAMCGWLLELTSGAVLTGTVMPLNVLGVFALDPDDHHLDVVPISLLAVAALGVLVLASWRSAGAAIAVLAAVLLLGDLSAQAGIDRYAGNEAITFQLGTVLDTIAPGAPVSYDYDGYDARAANLYELEAESHAFHYFDSRLGQAPPDALVVATTTADDPPVPGARLVFPEPNVRQALWVVPGDLQDQLVARGFVLAEPGTVLPEAFYRAQVAVRRVGPDRVEVDLRRTSALAPWVRPGSLNSTAGNVVLAVHAEGTTTTVSLPRTLFPGEHVTVPVTLPHRVGPHAEVWAEVVAA
ncbi:MAG: hypothetical protein JWN67_4425 [Actinomycetia bacterium]|nr:hypothetical protein [Actinomycetes bacterium]